MESMDVVREKVIVAGVLKLTLMIYFAVYLRAQQCYDSAANCSVYQETVQERKIIQGAGMMTLSKQINQAPNNPGDTFLHLF